MRLQCHHVALLHVHGPSRVKHLQLNVGVIDHRRLVMLWTRAPFDEPLIITAFTREKNSQPAD
jgi:hypothetical protein